MRLPCPARFAVVALLLAVAAAAVPAEGGGKKAKPDRKLAIFIAAPIKGYSDAAFNDSDAMYRALRARGFEPEQILVLYGALKREQVLSYLKDAGRRVAGWSDGQVVLYLSCSGHFPPIKEGEKIKTGIQLQEDGSPEFVLWDEIFEALAVPQGVRLLLLPDCCYTNTLTDHTHTNNKVPANVSGFVLKAEPGELKCTANNLPLMVNGKPTWHGTLTYCLVRALDEADTVGELCDKVSAGVKKLVDDKRLAKQLQLAVVPLGDGKQKVFVAAPR